MLKIWIVAYAQRERLTKDNSYKFTANGRVPELQPLRELPSSDDIETWLDSSSKYHSCELVED